MMSLFKVGARFAGFFWSVEEVVYSSCDRLVSPG
jgi:hypothetical protein